MFPHVVEKMFHVNKTLMCAANVIKILSLRLYIHYQHFNTIGYSFWFFSVQEIVTKISYSSQLTLLFIEILTSNMTLYNSYIIVKASYHH